MNKILLSLIFILISFVGLAQENDNWKKNVQDSTPEFRWANQINQLISPKYIFRGYRYNETNVNGQDLVIVEVTDTTYEAGSEKNKIFVFELKNLKLNILESSGEYEHDGRGPDIETHSDSLIVTHSFHHGYATLIYKFNSSVNKYLLSIIGCYSLQPFSKHVGLNFHWHYEQIYDVGKQTLTVKSGDRYKKDEGGEQIWSKEKVIPRKCPSTLSLKLKDMKDPSECEEYHNILDPGNKVFHYLEYASPPPGTEF